MRVIWDDQIPADILPIIKQYVEPCLILAPPWVQLFYVKFTHDANDGCFASMQISYEYRWASLRIHNGWLTTTDFERDEAIVHEMMHCYTNILSDWIDATLKDLLPDGRNDDLRTALDRELTRRCETVNQDLTFLVFGKREPDESEMVKRFLKSAC